MQKAIKQARPVIVQHLNQRLRRREKRHRQKRRLGRQSLPQRKKQRQQRQPLSGMLQASPPLPPVAVAQRQQQQSAAKGELRQRPPFAKRPAPPGIGPGQGKQAAQQP